MKRVITMAAVVPAVFSAAFSLVACDSEARSATVRPALSASLRAQAMRGHASEVDCDPVLERLLNDAQALQATPAFEALTATPEYEAVMNDEVAVDENHCEGDDAKPACDAILDKYAADQEALENTEEFQTLQATPEYQKLEDDVVKAQELGCIDGGYRL